MPKSNPLDNELMFLAWGEFMQFAVGSRALVTEYNAVTGSTFLQPAGNMLEVLIDDATGKIEAEVVDFMLWVTELYWGVDDAPPKVREEIAQRKRLRSRSME